MPDSSSISPLLVQLQQIWEDIGETHAEVEKALQELDEECVQVYRRKLEQLSQNRARLHQSVAEKEAELAALFAVLGERPSLLLPTTLHTTDRRPASLKAQLSAITPRLEEFRARKEERLKLFREVRSQIQRISNEIAGTSNQSGGNSEFVPNNEDDLSARRLDEYRAELQVLQREKSERLRKVLECVKTLHGLCSVLGMDFTKTITDVHPSLNESSSQQPKNISDETLERLSNTVQGMTQEKRQRSEALQASLSSLTELWELLDTPHRERKSFHHIIRQGSEISTPGGLSLDAIEQVKTEVQRLEKLKASKMKELVLKKRLVLEDVCRRAHMEPDASTASDKTNALIDTGTVDASELLMSIEEQIVRAQEEAESRKEILERVEKWLGACEEERWLEDYNMDENRYSATKGAHLNLKRAEKARITVSRLPVMVDGLIAKTRAWEEEKGMCFLFDGLRLLVMLDDYILNRHLREEEKRRMRDQKKMQDMVLVEKELMYGSRPRRSSSSRLSTPSTPCTPRRSPSMTRPPTPDSTPRSNGNHINNGNGNGNGNGHSNGHTSRHGNHHNHISRATRGNGTTVRPTGPLNFVAMLKDDAASVLSAGGSDCSSPAASSGYV